MNKYSVLVCIAMLLPFTSAIAETIASDTGGGPGAFFEYYAGESFEVTAGDGPFDDITFAFLFGSDTASGTAYLFSAPYAGTPAGLATASTDLLGSAAASGNVYTFSPSLTLQSGTTYYLYEDTDIDVQLAGGNSSAYDYYFSSGGGYAASSYSGGFVVTGTSEVTATPEPSSLLLLGSAALGIPAALRRRFHRRTINSRA